MVGGASRLAILPRIRSFRAPARLRSPYTAISVVGGYGFMPSHTVTAANRSRRRRNRLHGEGVSARLSPRSWARSSQIDRLSVLSGVCPVHATHAILFHSSTLPSLTTNLGSTKGDLGLLVASIEAMGRGRTPRFIVLDTLAQMLHGADENGAGMSAFIQNAQTLANQFEAFVLATQGAKSHFEPNGRKPPSKAVVIGYH